jgi:putative ABC transport system permease protein
MNPHKKPPSWALRFLQFICPEELFEEIEGDLIQRYNNDCKNSSVRKAKRKLLWTVFKYVQPGIIFRNKFSGNWLRVHSLQSYFKVALRHIARRKVFTLINVSGLAVSMVAFLLIIQHVNFEMSFDQFHLNKAYLYRVALERYGADDVKQSSAKNFAGLRSLFKDNFPEVESFTAFYKTPANTGFLFRHNGNIYNEGGGVLNPDSAFFKVFPSLLLRGDPMQVLADPHNLLITESMAKKLFGNSDPVGQTIERIDDYDPGADFVISGVIKDFPENSHFRGSFIRHINDSWPDMEYWGDSYVYNYIALKPGANAETVALKLNSILKKLAIRNPKIRGANVLLQPVTDIHLSSHFSDELEANGNLTLVYLLFFIGIVILILAWINYVNLETARFIARAREVGVRRIIGSKRSDLALQFLVEYSCTIALSIFIAVVLLVLIVPHFSYLTGVPLSAIQWFGTEVWIAALSIFFVGSFIAGIYPALFLMKLNPASALKGDLTKMGRSHARSYLTIMQFTVSLVMIAFLIVVDHQIDFMRSTNKKIDIEQIISIENPMAYSNEDLFKKYNDFKLLETKLMQNHAISLVSSSSAIPGTEIGFTYVNLIKQNQSDPFDPTPYKTIFVNHNFLSLYGLRLMAGSDFGSPKSKEPWRDPWANDDWTRIILNERATRALGFRSPEEAVNATVEFRLFDDFLKYKIIGVVQDYHHEAIKKEVYPMIFAMNYSTFQQVYFSVKLKSGSNPADVLPYIQKSWKEIFPDRPFQYFFLDDYYDRQFKSEIYFSRIFSMFATIAIFIACLGMLGMTLFEANARVKEISIRKILGASVSSLIALLSRYHLRVVCAAWIISIPVIYFISRQWLSTYPVKIELSPLLFLVPMMLILVMVIISSGFQTVRTALTNPVDHLKNE